MEAGKLLLGVLIVLGLYMLTAAKKGKQVARNSRCERLWQAYSAVPGGMGIGTRKQVKAATGIDLKNKKQTRKIACKIAAAKSVDEIAEVLGLPSAKVREYWNHASEHIHNILDKGQKAYLSQMPYDKKEDSRAIYTFLETAHSLGIVDLPMKTKLTAIENKKTP